MKSQIQEIVSFSGSFYHKQNKTETPRLKRFIHQPFKRQPHKMVKHTETIRLNLKCVWPFSGLALKGLTHVGINGDKCCYVYL